MVLNQILLVSGVITTIGVRSSLQFFLKRSNFKVPSLFHKTSVYVLSLSLCFQGTVFFVIVGWPVIGMGAEAYGFILLFSGFWPTIVGAINVGLNLE
ncbi:hypothetical protein L1987_76706 [Smallanthus sonchifolius]|uniref:Uncharacterized protein n=1 Tax=Smallanthus sonchifolius TaxID=185202 RepID=A0ACB8Z7X3_9ASTR|nr:hypothetical protein L1987_76706 [Smallanthus sonchifolius]